MAREGRARSISLSSKEDLTGPPFLTAHRYFYAVRTIDYFGYQGRKNSWETPHLQIRPLRLPSSSSFKPYSSLLPRRSLCSAFRSSQVSPRTTGPYMAVSHGTAGHIVGTQKTCVEPTCCLFSFLLPRDLSPLPCMALSSRPWCVAHFRSLCCLMHCFPDLTLTGFQLRSNHTGLGVCPAIPLSPVFWPPA